jgi:ketosteroid isomerase-like protein
VPFPFLSAVVALAATTLATGTDHLTSLVDAERAFSRASVERGMRDAFLENLADDGVVFQPLAVNGKQVWQARAASKATLIWEPAFAEVAAAGDLGYTTGPWELRPPEEARERPVAHGHFVSVWRRAGDGRWRVVLDLGASHEAAEPGVGSGAFTPGPVHAAAAGADRSRAAEREIRSAEKRLSGEAQKRGFLAAFGDAAASDVRFNREGGLPAVGLEAARLALAADTSPALWTPQGAGASRSGDLGYSYGVRVRPTTSGAAPDTSVFLDVWRHEPGGHWRLVMAVDNPVEARGRP